MKAAKNVFIVLLLLSSCTNILFSLCSVWQTNGAWTLPFTSTCSSGLSSLRVFPGFYQHPPHFPPVWNSYMKMAPRSVTRSALPWKLLLGLSIHYPAISSDLLCRPYCNISSSWGSGRPGHWQKRNLNLAMLGETSATPSVVTKTVTSFEGLQASLWGNLQSCFLVIE